MARVTKTQALTANEFHLESGGASCLPGTHRGVRQERWRRNGKTQTWVSRPNEFRVPVKHGLYDYGHITQDNAHLFHVAEQCPARKEGQVH